MKTNGITDSILMEYQKSQKIKLQEEILVGEELFQKMIKFVNQNNYQINYGGYGDEAFPFSKHFSFEFPGKKFIHVIYCFRSANLIDGFEPFIIIHGTKNYGNKLKPYDFPFERFEDLTSLKVTKNYVVADKDESCDCANTICLYNEFLEMVNK